MESIHAPEAALHAALAGNLSTSMPLLAQIPDLHHTGASKSAFVTMLEMSIDQNIVDVKETLYLMGANRIDWSHEEILVQRLLINQGFRRDLLSGDGMTDCWDFILALSKHHTLLIKTLLVSIGPDLESVLIDCDPMGLLAQKITPLMLDLIEKTVGHFDNGNGILSRLILKSNRPDQSSLCGLIENIFIRMIDDDSKPCSAYTIPLLLLQKNWSKQVKHPHFHEIIVKLFAQCNTKVKSVSPDTFQRWSITGLTDVGGDRLENELQQDFITSEIIAWSSTVRMLLAYDRRQELEDAGLYDRLKLECKENMKEVGNMMGEVIKEDLDDHWQIHFHFLRLAISRHLLALHLGKLKKPYDVIKDLLSQVRTVEVNSLKTFGVHASLIILDRKKEYEYLITSLELIPEFNNDLVPVITRIIHKVLKSSVRSEDGFAFAQDFFKKSLKLIDSIIIKSMIIIISCNFFSQNLNHPLTFFTLHLFLNHALTLYTDPTDLMYKNICLSYPLRLWVLMLQDKHKISSENDITTQVISLSPMTLSPQFSLAEPDNVSLGSEMINFPCPVGSSVLRGVDFNALDEIARQLKQLNPDFDIGFEPEQITQVGFDLNIEEMMTDDSKEADEDADSFTTRPCTAEGKLACGLTPDERTSLVEVVNRVHRNRAEGNELSDESDAEEEDVVPVPVVEEVDNRETLAQSVYNSVSSSSNGGGNGQSDYNELLKSATESKQKPSNKFKTAPPSIIKSIENYAKPTPLSPQSLQEIANHTSLLFQALLDFISSPSHLSPRFAVAQAIHYILTNHLYIYDIDKWLASKKKLQNEINDRENTSENGFPGKSEMTRDGSDFVVEFFHDDQPGEATNPPFIWFPAQITDTTNQIIFQNLFNTNTSNTRLPPQTVIHHYNESGGIRLTYIFERSKLGTILLHHKVSNESQQAIRFNVIDNVISSSKVIVLRKTIPSEMLLPAGQNFVWTAQLECVTSESFQVGYELYVRKMDGEQWLKFESLEFFSAFAFCKPIHIDKLPNILKLSTITPATKIYAASSNRQIDDSGSCMFDDNLRIGMNASEKLLILHR